MTEFYGFNQDDMIKCPAKYCKVRLPRSDTQAQVNHMNSMLAKRDKRHEDIIQERLRGRK